MEPKTEKEPKTKKELQVAS